jgi:hypothetical protein
MRHRCIYEKTVEERKKQPGTDEETNGEQPALEPFPLVREALGAKEVAFDGILGSELAVEQRYKAMKKVARIPPGHLADMAMLVAIAENLLYAMEHDIGPEIPRVWKRPRTQLNKKGETKTYYRWYCSWHDGSKTVTKYLGSCRKISEAEALEKAKKLMEEALPDVKEIEGELETNVRHAEYVSVSWLDSRMFRLASIR